MNSIPSPPIMVYNDTIFGASVRGWTQELLPGGGD